MESSSGSWESGDEDDDVGAHRNVSVVRETAAEIPVSRLSVVPDSDRRQKQQSTKTSLRGQHHCSH